MNDVFTVLYGASPLLIVLGLMLVAMLIKGEW
jgi:hypothetical protein